MKRLVVRVSVLALCSSPALSQEPAAQQPLQLTCIGGGTANKYSVATVHNNAQVSGTVGTMPVSGSGYGTSTITIPHHEGYADQVDVRLFSGDDRIRMPRTSLPMFHGGDGGWFKLKNVTGDGRSIRAEVAVNFINHPKVYIDRVTGTISISGKNGDFAGQCATVDPNVTAKF